MFTLCRMQKGTALLLEQVPMQLDEDLLLRLQGLTAAHGSGWGTPLR